MSNPVGQFEQVSAQRCNKDPCQEALDTPVKARLTTSQAHSLVRKLDRFIESFEPVSCGESPDEHSNDTNNKNNSYRCKAEICFYGLMTWPRCKFYVEDPESKKLLLIERAFRSRRCNGFWVVKVRENDQYLVVSASNMMYVSDEADVEGHTLEEIEARYG